MMRGIKVTREKIVLCGIGFFVGRAVCFDMNPLAAAFFAAAMIQGQGSIWLFLFMLAGLLTVPSISGAIAFGAYAILFFIGNHAMNIRMKQEENRTWQKCVLAAVCLILTQMLGWTLAGQPVEGSLLQAGGITYLWTNQRMTMLAFVQAMLEGVVTGCFAYLLVAGLSKREWQLLEAGESDKKTFLAMALVLALVLYGLPGSMYATFAISESVCYFAILYCAYVYGIMESTLVAAFSGAVLAYQFQDFSVLGLVTLFGLSAGIMRELGRIGVFLGMALAAVSVEFGVDGTSLASNSLKGLLTAGVIFLFLPKALLQQKNVDETALMDLLQEQLGRTAREKMREFADGFFKLQRGILRLPKPAHAFAENDMKSMYMQMKETVCDQCEKQKDCLGADPKPAFMAAKSVFRALDENGGIQKEDIPEEFSKMCTNQEAFLIGANTSYEKAKANRVLQQKMAESRQMLADQVGDVAKLMNEFSSELIQDCDHDDSQQMMLKLRLKTRSVTVKQVLRWKREHEPDVLYVVAQCHVGSLMTAREMASHISFVYQRPYRPTESCKSVVTKHYEVYSFIEAPCFRIVKGMQRKAVNNGVNGDNYSFLELEQGQFVAMLSDGMGTGQKAYDESALLVELLEDFLEAGFSQNMALKLANSVLTLNYDVSTYATLDFFSLDLFTGVARIIKIGAAATFVKRKGEVEVILSTSLPAGVFSQMDCDAIEWKMQDGDLVVMVSDGVMDAVIVEQKEAYIKDILMQMSETAPQMIANRLLEKIYEEGMSRVRDDMTILAFSVWKSNRK